MDLLPLAKPAQHVIPEVSPPTKNDKVNLDNKAMWTIAVLVIYLVCSHIPLYGLAKTDKTADPFYLMRILLASSRGSLMELGISPIITSGMVLQLLTGLQFIKYDASKPGEQQLFNTASKLLSLVITLGQAISFVLSGYYGDIRVIGIPIALALIAQLTFSGIIVLTLDDVLSKGWGLGGGINLFIVTNICETVIWQILSPMNQNGHFQGVLISLVFTLVTNPTNIFREMIRDETEGSNVLNVLATFVVFLIVVYLQGFKYNIKFKAEKNIGGRLEEHPIKLFYTSNMPIILLSALVSQVYFISQILYRRNPTNILIQLMGVWTEDARGSRPVSGLAYYISPPTSFLDAVTQPFHAVFYIIFMLTCCALFARLWISITGQGGKALLDQYYSSEQKLVPVGDSKVALKRVTDLVDTAAAFGGICIAAISIFADLFGALGNGTGVLMVVTMTYELWEKVDKDMKEEIRKQEISEFTKFFTPVQRYIKSFASSTR